MIHGTSRFFCQDAPLHFHLPLLPFQPPTSKDERLNEHQVSGPQGPLTNPQHRAGLVSPLCCKENGTIHRFLAKLFQGLEFFHRITERSDQLTDFKTWSRTGTNSREELDSVFKACHLCWRQDDDFGILWRYSLHMFALNRKK